MPILPVLLILISCFMHAGWNLLARRQRRELAFFRHLVILSVPIGAAAIGVGLFLPHSLPLKAVACVVASSVICGFYYWFLGMAYKSSDFTIVYPVARALPVLMVAGLDILRGRHPSGMGWLGLALVVGGCMLAPQASYAGFSLRRYHAVDILYMGLTALTIVGFTMFDKIAAEAVRRGPASAAIYCGLFHIISCVAYFAIYTAFEKDKSGAREVGWKWPAVGAVLAFFGYLLVLWAYQLAPQTSYLLAFRQFSIVLGVVAAFWWYGERGLAVRVPSTLAIVAGLVLLVVAG
jgi:multidrug transporter EmrE-like cation transporter